MRYDTFKKVRKRQKQSTAKSKGTETNRQADQISETPEFRRVETDCEGDEMRDHISMRYRGIASKSTGRNSHRQIGIAPVDGDLCEGPSNLVDAIRDNKNQRKGFLPIAMPRSDPIQDEDCDYEYRSEFEAPEQIELFHSTSHEDSTRTEVSEITQLTYGIATRQSSPRNAGGLQLPPRAQDRFAPHVEHLEDLIEVSDESEENVRRIQVDVTDLDNIHEAVDRVRGDLRSKRPTPLQVENRYGLPYESTDYMAEDDASDDSWGTSIVGNSAVPAEKRTVAEPIDAEKIITYKATRYTSPKSNSPKDRCCPHQFLPRESTGSCTPKSFASVKETLSADGEVIIDLSEILDEDLNAIEVLKKSPRATSPTETTSIPQSPEGKPRGAQPELAPETPQSQPVRSSLSSQTPLREPPVQSEGMRGKTTDEACLSTEDKIEVQRDPQIGKHDLQVQLRFSQETSPQSPVNAFFAASMKAFTSLTGVIGSHLERLDLLPEKDVNQMLGVLDKDLKATSESVPQGKEVAEYIDQQFKENSCTTDNTIPCASPKDLKMDSKSNSIDELMDTMKTTYQNNVVNCGVQSLRQDESVSSTTPQTFMAPMTMSGSVRKHRSSLSPKNR